MKNFGLKDLPELPAGDDFEIFDEEAESSSSTKQPPKRQALGEKKKEPKMKLCLRREICLNEFSIEEAYVKMIESKQSS